MAWLKVTGRDPNQAYEQTDTFGSWRDMRNTGLRTEFMAKHKDAQEKDLPKNLRGKVKAKHCPKDETDWLLSENKTYQRVVHLDAEGFITYTYMEAKWVGKGDRIAMDREQFAYLLCTHLTLHLFCIGPNYWDHIWYWSPADEDELSAAEKKTHTGAWALFTNDWQHNMFGILRPCLFCPEMTWGNLKKYPGNAGNKGAITAFHGYFHMNAYTVFLSRRLRVGCKAEEDAKDRGKLEDKGMREPFGKNQVSKFCFSTAKLTTGLQYTEGQEVTINAYNQVAQYTVQYTDDQKVINFSRHDDGIR